MSCNIQYNDNYTIKTSQMSYFEDKLHLPMMSSHSNKLEESDCTVINIVGYVDNIKQQDVPTVHIESSHILPLTVHDLDMNKNHVHQTSSVVSTNFFENLISTNKSSKLSNALFTSLKTIKEMFSDEIREVTSQSDNFQTDYCDVV